MSILTENNFLGISGIACTYSMGGGVLKPQLRFEAYLDHDQGNSCHCNYPQCFPAPKLH